MSLILEALRKLERDKPAPERGVVVMTAAGLAGDRRTTPGWLWLGAGMLAGLALAVGVATLRQASPASLAPAPPPSATPESGQRPAAPVLSAAPASPALVAPPRGAWPAPAREAPRPTPQAAPQATPRPAVSPRAFVLQAISMRDGHAVALIDDRVLREGDVVDGVRIVRIGETEVEVEIGGERSVLRFP